MVTIGNKLIVTTQNGDVFGHDVTDHDIGAGVQVHGSKWRSTRRTGSSSPSATR